MNDLLKKKIKEFKENNTKEAIEGHPDIFDDEEYIEIDKSVEKKKNNLPYFRSAKFYSVKLASR